MASAAIAGLLATLELSIDGGTTYQKIGECKDMTLTVQGSEVDVTSHDSGDWKEFIYGRKEWSAEAEALYVDSNAGQDNVYTALNGKTIIKLRFRPAGAASGKDQFTGDALVLNWDLSGPNDDAAASKLSFKGTGALTKAAQP